MTYILLKVPLNSNQPTAGLLHRVAIALNPWPFFWYSHICAERGR